MYEVTKVHFDGRFSANKAYLCGPHPTIDAAVTCQIQRLLFERDIFIALFYSAADNGESIQHSALFKRI